MAILVVDDTLGHELAELIKERLTEVGCGDEEVVVALSEREALELLRRETFDIISLDGLGGGGLRILTKLVKEGHRGPVVFYSANASYVATAKRFGGSDMEVFALHKVMDPSEESDDRCTLLTWRNFVAGLSPFTVAAAS